jgi:hypothetical protein
MRLKDYVASKGCTIEDTTHTMADIREGRAPKYEVFAPEGFNFSGAHSLLCADAKDVHDRLDQEPLIKCEDDCDWTLRHSRGQVKSLKYVSLVLISRDSLSEAESRVVHSVQQK